jgi:hypothetical protein
LASIGWWARGRNCELLHVEFLYNSCAQNRSLSRWHLRILISLNFCLQDLRPTIPADTHPMLVNLLQKCWLKDPALRPTFTEILDMLNTIKEVCVRRCKCAFPLLFSRESHCIFHWHWQTIRRSVHYKRHPGQSDSGRRRGC